MLTTTWLRILTLTWLVTWVLSVPLFHVHVPDAKAGPVNLHSGLPHTVFSPDLPGEFSHLSSTTDHRRDSLDFSQISLSYPELGFTVLNKAKERNSGKPIDLAGSFCRPETLKIVFTYSGRTIGTGHAPALGPPSSSRAPPFLVYT